MTEELREVAAEKPAKAAKSKKVKVKILATEEEKGDAFLSVNGKNVLIKRGEPVEIDEMYLGVLNDSVIETVIEDYDATGRKIHKAVQIQRYPYQLLG